MVCPLSLPPNLVFVRDIGLMMIIFQKITYSKSINNNMWVQVYSSCSEEYRLTQSGYLNIPAPATNQFCYGPCLAETHRVLDCVDHSLSNFIFYNRATVNDIRATLQAACGHTHERGMC